MDNLILDILNESIEVKENFIRNNLDLIKKGVSIISDCLVRGNKVLLFGNGGSAADAQHIAAEFVNRFQLERHPLAALALTTDASVITSIANDYSFDEIFSKQIQALGKEGDVAIGITTSGDSRNVIEGLRAAKKLGLSTFVINGYSADELARFVDLLFCTDLRVTARIQEAHITLGHVLCDLVERQLFVAEGD